MLGKLRGPVDRSESVLGRVVDCRYSTPLALKVPLDDEEYATIDANELDAIEYVLSPSHQFYERVLGK
jgi:hypothetical protein